MYLKVNQKRFGESSKVKESCVSERIRGKKTRKKER